MCEAPALLYSSCLSPVTVEKERGCAITESCSSSWSLGAKGESACKGWYYGRMKELEDEVRQFLAERGWDRLRPSDLAKSVSIEAAELLELFQWQDMDAAAVKNDPALLARVKKEIADVMIYCINMTVGLDLDTAALVREKIEHNRKKYLPEAALSLRGDLPAMVRYLEEVKKKYRAAE